MTLAAAVPLIPVTALWQCSDFPSKHVALEHVLSI